MIRGGKCGKARFLKHSRFVGNNACRNVSSVNVSIMGEKTEMNWKNNGVHVEFLYSGVKRICVITNY